MRRSRIFTALILSLSLISVPSSAVVKAGAKCTKAGATATSAGKKLTCIKSGSKFVWNKGTAFKAAPKPAGVVPPENKPEDRNLLATDSRITPTSALTSVDICKTEDVTPDYKPQGLVSQRNGFPRPPQVITGKKSAKLLVVPIVFNDLPFTVEKSQRGQSLDSDLDIVKDVIAGVKESFKDLSSGRFDVTIDLLPQKEWLVVKGNNSFSQAWGVNQMPTLMQIVEQQKPEFTFDGYDSYIFVVGNGPDGAIKGGSAQAAFAEPSKRAKSGTFNPVLLLGGYSKPNLWVHELGHALYAFEDLYLFKESSNSSSGSEVDVPLRWDLMANADRGNLLHWNKLLMGWTYDSEVRCLTDQKSSVHYLSTVGTSKDSKILTINLAPGVTLAAESRISTADSSGLLLYTINTHLNHGEGPILAQKSLIPKGQSKSIYGWQFSVLESDANGVLIEAVKTDIDKFVPPAPRPQQSTPIAPTQPTSPIQVSRGEVVPDGFLKAKATWNVTGHESYRLYITDPVDFQKVYFESGYVNDSRNPIVVEIKGLVCNKEFRTMTEFFTKKNGEGEKLVMPSTQLRNFSCEDTTKKP